MFAAMPRGKKFRRKGSPPSGGTEALAAMSNIELIPGGKKKNKKHDKAAKALEPKFPFKRRMPCLLIIFGLLFLALIVRVFYLTNIDSENLKKLAIGQWTRSTALSASRGKIVDCNGETLAVDDASVYKVVIWPQSIKSSEQERVARELSSVLGVDYDNLYARIISENVREYVVKRQIDKQTADTIRALQLGSGVGITSDVKRYDKMRLLQLCQPGYKKEPTADRSLP